MTLKELVVKELSADHHFIKFYLNHGKYSLISRCSRGSRLLHHIKRKCNTSCQREATSYTSERPISLPKGDNCLNQREITHTQGS